MYAWLRWCTKIEGLASHININGIPAALVIKENSAEFDEA
jgi:hypothetical protein